MCYIYREKERDRQTDINQFWCDLFHTPRPHFFNSPHNSLCSFTIQSLSVPHRNDHDSSKRTDKKQTDKMKCRHLKTNGLRRDKVKHLHRAMRTRPHGSPSNCHSQTVGAELFQNRRMSRITNSQSLTV